MSCTENVGIHMHAHVGLHRQAYSAHTQTNTHSQTHSCMGTPRALVHPFVHIKVCTHLHMHTPPHSHACTQFQMCMPRACTPSNINILMHTLQGHTHKHTQTHEYIPSSLHTFKAHKHGHMHPHARTHKAHTNEL